MSEVAEFWLLKDRYLQQVGDSEPQYVAASPDAPVKVCLPAKIKRKVANGDGSFSEVELDLPDDGHLKRIKAPGQKAPAEPKDVRPKVDRPSAKLAPDMVKAEDKAKK